MIAANFSEDSNALARLHSKFYVKTKSVYVIMETCNDDAIAHQIT